MQRAGLHLNGAMSDRHCMNGDRVSPAREPLRSSMLSRERTAVDEQLLITVNVTESSEFY